MNGRSVRGSVGAWSWYADDRGRGYVTRVGLASWWCSTSRIDTVDVWYVDYLCMSAGALRAQNVGTGLA